MGTKTVRPVVRAIVDALVLEVHNVDEPDAVVRFEADGQSAVFGRDDAQCDVVIWSALNGHRLSRVAGRIWRLDGRLWLQNLSLHHELLVLVPGGSAQCLPPRESLHAGGPGLSLPWGDCVILGPDGCELHVTQEHQQDAGALDHPGPLTEGLPSIPAKLWDVAVALCEPLLLGAPAPATYRQIAQRLNVTSYKRIRLLVADLCELFRDFAPAAAPEPELDDVEMRLERGVWRFSKRPGTPSATPLTIPQYVPVAELLVRRRVVRREHVTAIESPLATAPELRTAVAGG